MIRTGTDRLTDYAHYHKPSKSKNTITKGTYRPTRTHPANTDHNRQRIDNNSRERNLRQAPTDIPDQGRPTQYPPCLPRGKRSQTEAPFETVTYREYFRYPIWISRTYRTSPTRAQGLSP